MQVISDLRQRDLTDTLEAVQRFLETAGLGDPSYLVTADSLAGLGSVAAAVRNSEGVSSFWLIRVVSGECEVVRQLTASDHAALVYHGECDPVGVGE